MIRLPNIKNCKYILTYRFSITVNDIHCLYTAGENTNLYEPLQRAIAQHYPSK